MTNIIQEKNISQTLKETKVFFVTKSASYGSAGMRGTQISNYLNLLGVNSESVPLKTLRERIHNGEVVKDSIIVAIKWLSFDCIETYFPNNKIIVDLVDKLGILRLKKKNRFQNLDGFIFPNKNALLELGKSFPKNIKKREIYHHWLDVHNIPKNTIQKVTYIGNRRNFPMNKQLFKNLDFALNPKTWIQEAYKREHHLSIRCSGRSSFKYKPNTKLSLAAGTDSYIILTRDNSHIELLPEDYPFFVEYEQNKIQKMIDYITTEKSQKDKKIAKMHLEEVKKRTYIDRICQDYIDFFEEILA